MHAMEDSVHSQEGELWVDSDSVSNEEDNMVVEQVLIFWKILIFDSTHLSV